MQLSFNRPPNYLMGSWAAFIFIGIEGRKKALTEMLYVNLGESYI